MSTSERTSNFSGLAVIDSTTGFTGASEDAETSERSSLDILDVVSKGAVLSFDLFIPTVGSAATTATDNS